MRTLSYRHTGVFDRFRLGVAYYPEHWSEKELQSDPERMREAGIDLVRLGEFAWDLLEPEDGVFDFHFFDQAIEHLSRAGIEVIFCTPTAAPPRWMTRKHPDFLRCNGNGVFMQHGSRQHVCTTNAEFRKYSKRITLQIAEHYKKHSAVIAFQTDNELHCHFTYCYCSSCQKEFQNYLREKYASIDRLNHAWGTSFWAQSYHDFSDIELPREQAPAWPNPAAMLEMRRFHAAMAARYQHEQVEILRAANPRWIIFHNGLMAVVDYRGEFGKDLDLIGFDCYPGFVLDALQRPVRHAFTLDRARAIDGNFIVPEHQSSFGGQNGYVLATPEPGELRQQTFRSIAHGADSIIYFRWRSCRFGSEEYWGGILDHDNIPRRRFHEVTEIARELKALVPYLQHSEVRTEIGIAAADADAEAVHAIYPMGFPSPDAVAEELHRVFHLRHYPVGLVHPEDDLSPLKLYFLPHWELLREEAVNNLSNFVEAGGTLVIGARSGTRTADNQIISEPRPGILTRLAGVTVEEYGKLLPDDPHSKHAITLSEQSVRAEHFYELLNLKTATAVACWNSRFLAGAPAITMNRLGQGKVFYVGTYLTGDLAEALVPFLAGAAKLSPILPGLPDGLEVIERYSKRGRLFFGLNNTDSPLQADMLPGCTLVGPSDGLLAPYGVRITVLPVNEN